MTCAEFSAWLDEGSPEASGRGESARRHAAGCETCRAALAAAFEIDLLLEAIPMRASSGFVERTMARVAAARRASSAAGPDTSSLPAWWVRAAADPATVLAFLLAGLLVGQSEALAPIARNAATALFRLLLELAASIVPAGTRAALATEGAPRLDLAVVVGLSPVIVAASLLLFEWGKGLASGRPAPPIGRAAR